jgi:phosphopantothenoylcysteine decarboxylase / phosphopantothenate---cysteine ligase
MLFGKRILLIIGGGIAAYKSLELIRRLRERGALVRVVMTAAAQQFVSKLSAASLSSDKVYDDLFSLTDEAEMGHIELSREADLLVVAPATADLLAKMAYGLANDLAATVLLATDKKILAAPAMNVRMWLHPATRRNVATLRADGVSFIGPNDGEMACGEFGPGRMAEAADIVHAAELAVAGDTRLPLPAGLDLRHDRPLAGKKVIITSGPTFEPIDPVRYIGNHSSGKQGHAIATAAASAGGDVILVSGPVAIADPVGMRVVHVTTAQEMQDAVNAQLPAEIFISVAAVADWRIAQPADQKISKTSAAPVLMTVENPDILASVAQRRQGRPVLVVGFAAETQNVIEHARAKLQRKGCDLIVANDVSSAQGVMGGSRNTVHLVSRTGVVDWPMMDKDEVARRLVAHIAALLPAATGGGKS